MWIVRLALRRPYTFVVAAILLLLLTPFVLLRTPTDIFPNIDIPVVSVIWRYDGLDAQEMEQRLIYNSERPLTTTVNNIEHIESTSYNGIGVIKVFFQPGASVNAAVAEITAICQTVLRSMPPGTTPPLIIRYNASTVPILQYGISAKNLSEQEIFDVTVNQIRIGLVGVPGSAINYPYGGKLRLVSVDLDLAALKAKNLTPTDVVNAVNAQNLIYPAGTAKIGPTEYDIEVNTSPQLMEDLNDLPIVDPRGLVTPFFDGWSIDTWMMNGEGVSLVPSRLMAVQQEWKIQEKGNPQLITKVEDKDMRLCSCVEAYEQSGIVICQIKLTALATTGGWLIASLRPCNPEGISFIHKIREIYRA